MDEVMEKESIKIENMIYEVNGVQAMVNFEIRFLNKKGIKNYDNNTR